MDQAKIRNFCIIAHIDHGKSTLADRLLEITGTVEKRKMRDQILDQMDLERERGITIKLQPVRMTYRYNPSLNPSPRQERETNEESAYQLNLIDTPGHVDFTYEVSRSLAAVEGAILVVDATQGIQAQTLANVNLAREHKLKIIPVVNKIDLPNAEPEKTAMEIKELINQHATSPVARPFMGSEILFASAKTGENVEAILEAIVARIPLPQGDPEAPLQALIFDSKYDKHRGVVAYVRIVNGRVGTNEKIKMIATGAHGQSIEVGYFGPEFHKADSLSAGEIGYIVTGLREVNKVRVGDTITTQTETDLKRPRTKTDSQPARGGSASSPPVSALPGYRQVKPMVYASIFPASGDDYALLRESLEKLKLNDASLSFEPENIPSLGFGFRAGFLGLLHMDIVAERLKREFDLDLVLTSPSVAYVIRKKNSPQELPHPLFNQRGEKRGVQEGVRGSSLAENEQMIYSPAQLPGPSEIESISEPWMKLDILTPEKSLGAIMNLVTGRRGIYKNSNYLGPGRLNLHFEIPLANLISDFYDKLKSVSSGYASMNYELLDYRPSDLVRLDILVAGDKVGALSRIVPRENAESEGRAVVEKLKELLPRQQFAVALQAAVGGKIIARETIPALRKDVTAKLYGGDVTRKMKLLKKQKKGKKRLKAFGKVEIPQEAFLALMKH